MPETGRWAVASATTAAPSRQVRYTDPRTRWLGFALAVLPALTFLVRVIAADSRWRLDLYEDDAYYYLGVARSIAEGHGSTFTGLVETNGYHPLWLGVLVPLAAAFRDPSHVVVAVAIVQGVLWVWSVREVVRIGRLAGCETCAAAAVAVFGVLAVTTGHLAFNGMESALVLPLLLTAVRRIVDTRGRAIDDLRLGVVLALLCLARLDAAVAAVTLGFVASVAAGAWSRRDLTTRGIAVAAPPAVALLVYAVVNVVVFDSVIPVSGRAKGLGAPFLNTEPLTQVLKSGDFDGRSLWFGVVALSLVAAAWATRTWRSDGYRSRLMACTLALVTGEVLLLAYLVTGTSYRVWPWYHYQVATFSCLATVIVLRWARDRYGSMALRLCMVIAVGFLAVQAAVMFRPEEHAYRGSVEGAEYIQEHTPDDAILAMGDRAGIFGFLSDRPLLQLEGLMADVEFLSAMRSGDIASRMIAEGVDYYVHYGPPGQYVKVDGGDCQRFEEPLQGDGPKSSVVVCDENRVFVAGDVGDRFEIWRFRPELNSG
jgi:hypothetical protein